jgi:glycosyltransferase involved in cell wall biosynthesis
MAKKISVVIPVFNEARNLPLAVAELEAVFRKDLPGYALEIIVTDNCSTDDTWAVARELAKNRPEMKAFRFSRNFGYQNSIFAGLSLASGDAVVEMDADLEDPPGIIPQFVKHWEAGYEVAFGVRAKRHSPWLHKVMFSAFYRILNKISDFSIPENSGDFRLLDRKVIEVLKALPERNLYLRGLVSYLGFKQIPVVYDRHPRVSGFSKFRWVHYFILALDALTAFSKTPLRLIGVAGVGLCGLAIGVAAYYLIGHWLHGTPVAGFTTLVVLMLFLHSVTFIFIGILGEYLSRIFDDSKNRPRVIIADAIGATDFPRVL